MRKLKYSVEEVISTCPPHGIPIPAKTSSSVVLSSLQEESLSIFSLSEHHNGGNFLKKPFGMGKDLSLHIFSLIILLFLNFWASRVSLARSTNIGPICV